MERALYLCCFVQEFHPGDCVREIRRFLGLSILSGAIAED